MLLPDVAHDPLGPGEPYKGRVRKGTYVHPIGRWGSQVWDGAVGGSQLEGNEGRGIFRLSSPPPDDGNHPTGEDGPRRGVTSVSREPIPVTEGQSSGCGSCRGGVLTPETRDGRGLHSPSPAGRVETGQNPRS